jgi:iron complex transport system substrate-binding protein
VAKWRGGGLAGLLALGLAACGPSAEPDSGRPPERIVSLFPSWTEVLYALDLGDRLVARGKYSDYPPSVKSLPIVGDGFGNNLEALLRLEPDLVIVYDDELSRRIRRLGIRAVSVQAESLQEIYAAYETIAAAAGAPGRGRALAARVRGEIEAVARRYRDRPRRRVLFCVDGKSGHVVGPGNFVHELLTAVGGVNVAADASGPFPVYSLEAALRKDPEVILDASGSYGSEDPSGSSGSLGTKTFIQGLRETTAGRQGKILAVSQNLVTRSGPRLGEAARRLGELIHRTRVSAR